MLGVLGDTWSVGIQYFSSPILEMKLSLSGVILPKFPVSLGAVPSPQRRSSALAGVLCDRAPLLGLCWVLAWG